MDYLNPKGIVDICFVGKKHDHTVDAGCYSSRGGHAFGERFEKFFIERSFGEGWAVDFRTKFHVLHKTPSLFDRICKFLESISQFNSACIDFKTPSPKGAVRV